MAIACIDIGGTFIKSAVLKDSVLFNIKETPTDAQKGGLAVLNTVEELIRTMPDITSIGVSTAGEVDSEAGKIRLSDNIPGYTGLNVKNILQNKLKLPVAVENDVNSAAIGENKFGAVKNIDDFIMISYGTGIGGAIVIGGELYKGENFSAGEIGGLITHASDVCKSDRGSGSYERYASTSALVDNASRHFAELDDGRKIFAQLDTPQIKKIVDDWILEISYGLVSVIHMFNPKTVVLGGGTMRESYIRDKISGNLEYLLKDSFKNCSVISAKLGNEASLMGAGFLAQCL